MLFRYWRRRDSEGAEPAPAAVASGPRLPPSSAALERLAAMVQVVGRA